MAKSMEQHHAIIDIRANSTGTISVDNRLILRKFPRCTLHQKGPLVTSHAEPHRLPTSKNKEVREQKHKQYVRLSQHYIATLTKHGTYPSLEYTNGVLLMEHVP